MTLGERITECRKDKEMTQQDLAQIVGCTRQMIINYEADKSDPRLFIVTCIADALGVTLDYLVKGGNRI